MPTILKLTLVMSAAVTAGLFAGGPATLAAAALSIAAVIHRSWLATFAALGIALGGLQAEARNQACWRFQDGQHIRFTGVLESLPVSEKIALRMLQPCRVVVSGRLPRNVRVPAGLEFSAHGQWQAMVMLEQAVARPGGGILVIAAVDSITTTPHRLLRWRAHAQARIRELFPAYAPLAEALLVAQRDGLDGEIRQRYAASGLTHLLAISGTHVALVAAALWLLARLLRVSRLASHVLCVLGAAAYVFFLGAPFAAVRALLQIVLVIIARNLQRPAHPLGLVAAAALVIVACFPHALLDAGFQLSFAGIVAIVLWRRPLIDRMPRSIPVLLRDAVATTLAATVVTTPIAALHFGMVSVIALVANLLAIPAVSLAVPASAAALAVSAVSRPAARFLAAGAEISLASLDRVAMVSAAVPYGHFAAHPRQLLALLPHTRRQVLEIHMIDVGQGDGIAIRTPDDHWIVVDAGPASPTFDAGEKRIVPFLMRKGVRVIDALILTHPDLDHFGGARSVVRLLRVNAIYEPGVPVAKELYDSLLQTALHRHTGWRRVRTGAAMRFGQVSLEFLHPDTVLPEASEAANDYSAVFRLTYGEFSALFLGDISTVVEDALVSRYGSRLDVDLLKVAHHGSGTSTGAVLLSQTTPAVALVPVGRRNRYRHPSPAVIERLEAAGAVVFRTDDEGTVSLQITKNGRVRARTRQ